jgi:phage host-nuclease inhibitor protein Gam
MFLKDNPVMMAEIEEKVKGILGIKVAEGAEGVAEEPAAEE